MDDTLVTDVVFQNVLDIIHPLVHLSSQFLLYLLAVFRMIFIQPFDQYFLILHKLLHHSVHL